MEFNEKLQKLRKQKGITQEELGEILFVSRAAISKWESGRGYPNIDSLKEMARYFDITIDELLSCNELLSVAEQESRQKESKLRDTFFSSLDVSFVLLFILPFFAQIIDGTIYEVSLLGLTEKEAYIKIVYIVLVTMCVVFGIVQIVLNRISSAIWSKNKYKISIILNLLVVTAFIITSQPYAAVLSVAFLIIKFITVIKL